MIEWDVATGGKKTVYAGARKNFDCGGHFEQVLGITYCKPLNLVVSVGVDQLVRLWDPRTPEGCVDALRGHRGAISAVVADPYSADHSFAQASSAIAGTQVLTASYDKTVRLWDLEHRACELSYF